MPCIHLDGEAFECRDGETVLECLERNDRAPGSSCRSGVCQSCMMRATEGDIPHESQKGLSAARIENGYFLTCVCRPAEDLTLVEGDGAERHVASVTEIAQLNDRIIRVRLRPEGEFTYRAGQFINLIGPNEAVRSYSLASVCDLDDDIELQVAIMPDGVVSEWLHNDVSTGDTIAFLGPQGNCFYTDNCNERSLILAGTGTGLAPLYGILRDALNRGHSESITLVHGGVKAEDLYLVDELRQIADDNDNVDYHACALEASDSSGDIPVASIDDYVKDKFNSLEDFKVFLCGHPDTVRKLQRATFMAGASLADISADAFLPAAR